MTARRQPAVVDHGYQPPGAAGAALVMIETGGAPVGVVRHLAKHSRTGMSWGYAGSGPADGARCAGTGTVVDAPAIDRQLPDHPARDDRAVSELVMDGTPETGFAGCPTSGSRPTSSPTSACSGS